MKKKEKKTVKKANKGKASSAKTKTIAKKAKPKAKPAARSSAKVRAPKPENAILVETVEILENPLNLNGPFVSELEEDTEEEVLVYSGLENEAEIQEEAYDYLKGTDSNSVDCE